MKQQELRDIYRITVNQKLADAANTLFDLVFSGVMERFPKLSAVYVENEVGWLPFSTNGKYYIRHSPRVPLLYMKRLLGNQVKDQVYATFFSDPAGGRLMEDFGQTLSCGPTTIRMQRRGSRIHAR